MDLGTQVQILSEIVCISYGANTLEKGMTPTILPPVMGKYGPGDQGSIPGRVIPKTLKMVLDTSLLSTQQYNVRIKGKVEQSRERSSTFPYTSV